MAKNVLLGKEKERQVKEQQKVAKAKNKKKRRSPARFFKDIWNELKKVTWPTGKDLQLDAGSHRVYCAGWGSHRSVRFWNAFPVQSHHRLKGGAYGRG
mgnify:CR=1 FL=1